MAEERSLSDLTLTPGMRAAAFGRLEHAPGRTYTLSVVPSWNPDQSCGYAEGLVPVTPKEWAAELPESTVNVTGTWTGKSLVDASFREGRGPLIDAWLGEPGALVMSQLGMQRYSELSSLIVAAGAAPVLSSGGSDAGIEMLVLFVTPSLVEVHRNFPVRADIYPAIAPLP